MLFATRNNSMAQDYAAALSKIKPPTREGLLNWWKAFLTPYYITIVVVLGLATGGFFTMIGLLILVASNFNILGLIE